MNQVGLKSLDIDLVSILIGSLMAGSGNAGAAIFAMFQGILTDVFSGGWPGLSALLYMAVFLTIHLGARFFDRHSSRGLFILVSMAVWVKGCLFTGFVYSLTNAELEVNSSYWLVMGASSLLSGFFAPLVFGVLNGLRSIAARDAEASGG